MKALTTDILIVGGGPAGMAAALAAAESGRSVTVVDDNSRPGGQIWRAELEVTKNPHAARLIRALDEGAVRVVGRTQVIDAEPDNRRLAAESPSGRMEFEYQKLIIATGARERFLPFPGWTLPNVLGAGGLQALVKSGMNVDGKLVVIAGTGALLLAVAEYLRSQGAKVLAIAEQAPGSRIRRFAVGLARQPSKLIDAVILRGRLLGVPYLTDCWVTTAGGSGRLTSVELRRKGKSWSVDCDILACGFHLVPNAELAALIGCRIDDGFVAVDAFQRTSCEDVYCAGEPTGIAGLDASLIEGRIAGLAAAGEEAYAQALFRERDRYKAFGRRLDRTFKLREELRHLASDDTIVCRCEDVELHRLTKFDNWRSAKLQSRCGMGPCQGRVCGPAAEFLFNWKTDPPRPPIFPVDLENL